MNKSVFGKSYYRTPESKIAAAVVFSAVIAIGLIDVFHSPKATDKSKSSTFYEYNRDLHQTAVTIGSFVLDRAEQHDPRVTTNAVPSHFGQMMLGFSTITGQNIENIQVIMQQQGKKKLPNPHTTSSLRITESTPSSTHSLEISQRVWPYGAVVWHASETGPQPSDNHFFDKNGILGGDTSEAQKIIADANALLGDAQASSQG